MRHLNAINVRASRALLGLAMWMLAAASANAATFALGASTVLEGPAAGSDTVLLSVTPAPSAWAASANAPWLHTTASGTTSGSVLFTFDANIGATRTGTLTIAGQVLTVVQAGVSY